MILHRLRDWTGRFPLCASILFSVLTAVFARFAFGIYYEEYGSNFTAALSGVLTPGMIYDHLYYMMYVGGLASVYAHLSTWFPQIPVINIIEYATIVICLAVIFFVYIKSVRSISFFEIALIAALCTEYFVLLLCSRISLLLCLVSAIVFFYLLKNKRKILSKEGLLFFALWTFGLFTRIETSSYALCMIGLMFLVLLYAEYNWRIKLKYYLLLFFAMISIAAFSFYVADQLKSSKEFYLQIEPDCEAEIMFKQNMIPISAMKNEVDSIRYEAIRLGVWGDAKVNDVHFIKSLINEEHRGFLFHWKGLERYQSLLGLYWATYKFYLIAYFMISIYILFGHGISGRLRIGLAFYQVAILLFCVFIAIQLKFTDRVSVPTMTGSMLLQLLVVNMYSRSDKRNLITSVLFVGVPIIMMMIHCTQISRKYNNDLQAVRQEIFSSEEIKNAKTIVLGKEYGDKFFKLYYPFESFEIFKEKKIFLAINLAFNTIQPYKKYLEDELNCDPEDFTSLFPALRRYDPNTLYLFTPEEEAFLVKYLRVVHNMEWEFRKKDQKEQETIH